MEWREETIIRLRALWGEGLSTAQIGLRLNVSKNAVVGKASRLGLPGRPSPIRRDGSGGSRTPRPRRVSGPTLPSLASTAAGAEPIAPPPPAPIPEPPYSPPVIARLTPSARTARPRRRSDGTGCCFPLGEPGTRSFRYCDDDLDITGEYCPEHHKLTVRQVRRPSLADKLAA